MKRRYYCYDRHLINVNAGLGDNYLQIFPVKRRKYTFMERHYYCYHRHLINVNTGLGDNCLQTFSVKMRKYTFMERHYYCYHKHLINVNTGLGDNYLQTFPVKMRKNIFSDSWQQQVTDDRFISMSKNRRGTNLGVETPSFKQRSTSTWEISSSTEAFSSSSFNVEI